VAALTVQLRQQLERLTDAYLRAVIPLEEYQRRRCDLEQRVTALVGQEERLRDDAERQRQLAGLAASLEAFRARVQGGLDQATFEQRHQLVLLLIDRVVVTDASVEIRYVLPMHGLLIVFASVGIVQLIHLIRGYR